MNKAFKSRHGQRPTLCRSLRHRLNGAIINAGSRAMARFRANRWPHATMRLNWESWQHSLRSAGRLGETAAPSTFRQPSIRDDALPLLAGRTFVRRTKRRRRPCCYLSRRREEFFPTEDRWQGLSFRRAGSNDYDGARSRRVVGDFRAMSDANTPYQVTRAESASLRSRPVVRSRYQSDDSQTVQRAMWEFNRSKRSERRRCGRWETENTQRNFTGRSQHVCSPRSCSRQIGLYGSSYARASTRKLDSYASAPKCAEVLSS